MSDNSPLSYPELKGDAYLSLHVRGQGAQLDIIEIKPMEKPMEKAK